MDEDDFANSHFEEKSISLVEFDDKDNSKYQLKSLAPSLALAKLFCSGDWQTSNLNLELIPNSRPYRVHIER